MKDDPKWTKSDEFWPLGWEDVKHLPPAKIERRSLVEAILRGIFSFRFM